MTTAHRGLTPTRLLGAGGEAEVFEVAERPGFAFKRFRNPTPARAAKLRVMLAHPPEGLQEGGHVAFAWPTELVPGSRDAIDGFLMPRIDLSRTVPVFQVYNPASRMQIAPGFTWRYLLRTARNVAAIVDSLHRAGYVIGDINESNLLVNRRALAVLVDCDSMQVRDPATGAVHRSAVGKPEFTAPELQGRDLSSVDRTTASDDFALAVLVFQLLMEGVHPFAGIWNGRGEPPEVPERMRRGYFPYRRGTPVQPPPRALTLDVLPPELRRMARRAFTTGIRRPSLRPTAAAWAAALERAEASLRTCDRSPHHVFAGHRRRCPWCERFDAGLPDAFPGPERASPLTRRPPPRVVRIRAAASARARAALMAAIASLGRGARAAGARVWGCVRDPLARPVPVAVAATAAGALLPSVAVALFAARHLAPALVRRRRPPWMALVREGATGAGIAALASALLHGGLPPLAPTAALAAGLVTFLGLPSALLQSETTGFRSSRPAKAVVGALSWALVVLTVATLLLLGPWWGPSLFG